MVVGVAVIEDAPVTALSMDEHLSVTFLNHPFACSSSTKPSGLYGVTGLGLEVGAAVSEVLL